MTTAARRRRRRKRPSVAAMIGQAAAVVGLITGLLTLVFIARPGCQPQPSPDVSSGHIDTADVERGVTFRYYLERASSPQGTLSQSLLARRGVLVVLHYSVQGYKGKRLPLRWQLFEQGGPRVDAGEATIRPGRNTDEFDGYVWVTPTGVRRSYYVVATLLQPNGRVSLGSYRSVDFNGVG